MTRLLLTGTLILSFFFIANAQLSKGNLLLGGTLSYYTNTVTNFGTSQTGHSGNFNVSLGKAISENSVFGVNLNYSFFHASNYYYQGLLGPLTYNNDVYSIGIFYRKYKALGKDFYLFGEAGAGYDGSTESGINETGVKQVSGTGTGGHISFYPGVDYKISKKFFFEISIPNLFLAQYSSTKSSNQLPENTKSDQFQISTSLSAGSLSALGIGFRLIL